MKVLLSDIGGVVARDLYNDLLDRLLLQESVVDPQAIPTEAETFAHIMKCATQSWSGYKIGEFDETVFFLNIIQQSTVAQELKRRGFLSEEQSSDETQVVRFLMQQVREGQLRLFDSVVDMMLDWKAKHASSHQVTFAVLSNHSTEWLPELFRMYSDRLEVLFDRKDFIFNSAVMKCAKPDLKAFLTAKETIESVLQQQNIPILFVDDKLANVNAAIEAGLSAVHFNALNEDASILKDHLDQFFL